MFYFQFYKEHIDRSDIIEKILNDIVQVIKYFHHLRYDEIPAELRHSMHNTESILLNILSYSKDLDLRCIYVIVIVSDIQCFIIFHT